MGYHTPVRIGFASLRESCADFDFSFRTEQSEEGRMRRSATLDERFDRLSQQLALEFPVARLKRHLPRMPPPAIERMALANSFSFQRIANAATLATRSLM
jgi:hypothetical protein